MSDAPRLIVTDNQGNTYTQHEPDVWTTTLKDGSIVEVAMSEMPRPPAELAEALRVRASHVSGQSWEAPATADMMREAAAQLDAALAEIARLTAENTKLQGELRRNATTSRRIR